LTKNPRRNQLRTTGKITAWKDDKGFGFITPSSGAKQVFVHISAFTDRRLRPQLFSWALIAQQTLRHKSRKASFRVVFWLTVILNCGLFIWLFTPTGSEMLRGILTALE